MSQIPSAQLFIAPGCQHCPTMLKNLSELIEVLEGFELGGLRSKSELLSWIDKASSIEGQSAYFEELITAGKISEVQQIIEKKPEHMPALFIIMASKNSNLSVRIGVSAVIEQLSGTEQLAGNISTLGQYCEHETARVRNDACYYLGLSRHSGAEEYIRPLLDDTDDDVKEVAREALNDIAEYTAEALQREGVFNITI